MMVVVIILCLLAFSAAAQDAYGPMSDERVVFEIPQGEIEFGFYPELAPVTSAHIFELCTLGLYTGNHIFRVDKNFVAQTADVLSGRSFAFPQQYREVAGKTVPLEVKKGAKHVEGIVSMARGQDPNSGSSSFFFMYSEAPHLDTVGPGTGYAAFGKVTRGMDVLHKLETLPTKTEGIFVMPLDRITILSTRWHRASQSVAKVPHQLTLGGKGGGGQVAKASGNAADAKCEAELEQLQHRFDSQARQLQEVRKKCLPGS